MKFFTKYLPVGGEIKEGDVYLSKWRKENKFNHTVPVGRITSKGYHDADNDSIIYPKDDVISKVKLFLCSRDIDWPKDLINQPNSIHIPFTEGEPYKVIGEVSSQAVWVKEGDELDEEDIQYNFIDYMRVGVWHIVNKTIYETQKYDKIGIKIKCSQCKTFH